MRRLSGVVLAGALLLLPAAFSAGEGKAYAQAPAATVTFDGDTAMMTVAIKPDKTADFEQIIAKVREALLKSDKPERKQQAAGWKLVKGPAMKDGNIIYIHMISPVVKGADYTILPILYEATTDPAEQRKLFEQYRDAFAGGLGNGTYNTVVDLSKP